MPLLDNPRHEKFAQAVASGLSGAAAYRSVYGPAVSARKRASELLGDRDIKGRVRELQGAGATAAIWTGTQIREYLTRALATPLEGVDEASTLCQSSKRTETMHEIKMVQKLQAAELLARMNGDLAAAPGTTVNVDVKVTVLSEQRRAELMERRRAALSGPN